MKPITYSVVIPVYNSALSLPELTARLERVFGEEIQASFEILFVDDHSPNPSTWPTLCEIATNRPWVRVFRLSRNFGQGGALLCGFTKATGQWIITMDDDLQHRPEDIPRLVSHCRHDVVIGRFGEKQCGKGKKLASRLKSYLDFRLLDLPRGVISSPFKIIKRRVVRDMLKIHAPRPFMIALILAVTRDIVNIEVTHEPRRYGDSAYSLRKSLSLFSNLIFNNSSAMLAAMSTLGFSMSALSFFLAALVLVRKLVYHRAIAGWASLMIALLMSTGLIVFCLGILGEYVARLIETTDHKPNFLIRETHEQVDDGMD